MAGFQTYCSAKNVVLSSTASASLPNFASLTASTSWPRIMPLVSIISGGNATTQPIQTVLSVLRSAAD